MATELILTRIRTASLVGAKSVGCVTTGIWSAASGASGRTIALDIAANNIANAGTPGFAADRAVFREELARAEGSLGRASSSQRFATARSVSRATGTGQLEPTGQPLDVALAAPDAFLVIRTPAGDRYTRAGSLRVRFDGTLITATGHPCLDSNRQPIVLPAGGGDPVVNSAGEVLAGDTPVARLLTVTFGNVAALEKEGAVVFRAAAGAGEAVALETEVVTESLEVSDVSAVKTMTAMVDATRQFDMLTRVIDAFGSIERSAATTVMKGR